MAQSLCSLSLRDRCLFTYLTSFPGVCLALISASSQHWNGWVIDKKPRWKMFCMSLGLILSRHRLIAYTSKKKKKIHAVSLPFHKLLKASSSELHLTVFISVSKPPFGGNIDGWLMKRLLFRISWINSLFLYLSVIFKDKIDISHIWQKIKLKKHIFLFKLGCVRTWASQVMLVVKNTLANAGDIREMGLIPGSGRSPGGGHGNPLQYSFLENPMDKESWQATVHRVAKCWTRRKRPSGEGNGTPLQYSCLENPMDRGAW